MISANTGILFSSLSADANNWPIITIPTDANDWVVHVETTSANTVSFLHAYTEPRKEDFETWNEYWYYEVLPRRQRFAMGVFKHLWSRGYGLPYQRTPSRQPRGFKGSDQRYGTPGRVAAIGRSNRWR